MKYLNAIIVLLICVASCAQSAIEPNCYNGSCRATKTIEGVFLYALVDSSGKKLTEYKYDNLRFTESYGILSFREKGQDLWGIINGEGDILIPANKYNRPLESRNGIVIAKDSERNQRLLDLKGNILIEGYNFYHLISNYPAVVWARKDSISRLYNRDGQLISDYTFKSYDNFGMSSDICDHAWITKSTTGVTSLVQVKGDEIEIEDYIDIFQPRAHSSCKVYTIKTESGILIKKYSTRSGKFVSEPIYKEVCFEPECLEPYRNKIPYSKIKDRITMAIGVLPNNDVHLIKSGGDVVLVTN